MNSIENTTTKPHVKHILSQELQLYFEKVCKAVLDEQQDEYRSAGLASLQNDPGLHQLVPYFVQFIAEKVTHNLKDLFVLTQMMHVTDALVRNPHLHIEPYVRSYLVPHRKLLLTFLPGCVYDTFSPYVPHWTYSWKRHWLFGSLRSPRPGGFTSRPPLSEICKVFEDIETKSSTIVSQELSRS